MKPSKTVVVDLHREQHPDPRFAICYARGQVFKQEGSELRVEMGRRALVNRTLCIQQHYGSRCEICPNAKGSLTLRASGQS